MVETTELILLDDSIEKFYSECMTASKPERDVHGRFLKKTTVHGKSSTGGTGNILSKLVQTEKGTDDETLVDIKITNPLHRITQILQEIKDHQATTFSFRFTIPIIALPIFLLVAFQLGRSETRCSESFTTKAGTVKIVEVMIPQRRSWFEDLLSSVPFIQTPTDTLMKVRRYLLLTPDNQTFTIEQKAGVMVAPFENQQVFLTGAYNPCSQVISLDSQQNISSAQLPL